MDTLIRMQNHKFEMFFSNLLKIGLTNVSSF